MWFLSFVMLFSAQPRPMGPPAYPYHCLPGATKCGGLGSLEPARPVPTSSNDRMRFVLRAALK